MSSKIHPIEKYNYSFDAQRGGPGKLQLWDSGDLIAEIKFVDDTSSVPAPVISTDLGSATIYFKDNNLVDLVEMLRSQRRLGLVIDDQGPVTIEYIYGLVDCAVVCSTCSAPLLAAKTRGIKEAMRRLVEFCGADALAEVCPLTFHLDGDNYCGAYESGDTGNFSRDSSGLGHVCLWDMEKENRYYPFTVEYAETIQDQLLPVHEAMHAWFVGRQRTYRITEPFCKLVSFIISEMSGGPEYCQWFASTPDDHPDVLMKYLCGLGMNSRYVAQTLALVAKNAAELGRALTIVEFAQVVTSVLGRDSTPAFVSAGLLT